jgi:hypothetical protein
MYCMLEGMRRKCYGLFQDTGLNFPEKKNYINEERRSNTQLCYRCASLIIEIKPKMGPWKCADTSEPINPLKPVGYKCFNML